MLALVLVYGYIEGPLIIMFGRKTLVRLGFLSSPFIIIPSSVGLGLYLLHDYGWYLHFIAGPAFFIAGYLFLWKHIERDRMESVLLSYLALIAADEIWQMPYNISNWSPGGLALAQGLATGAFSLVSIPVFFLVAGKVTPSWKAICIALAASAIGFVRPELSYLAMPAWMTAFISFVPSHPSVSTGTTGTRGYYYYYLPR